MVIHTLANAHEQIDLALSAALEHSKPVYICVACNLAGGCNPQGGCTTRGEVQHPRCRAEVAPLFARGASSAGQQRVGLQRQCP